MSPRIEFIYSETCPDCPPAKEIVERVKDDYDDLTVEYILAKENPGILDKYDITHVPTIVIDENVEFEEELTENDLRGKIEEYMR